MKKLIAAATSLGLILLATLAFSAEVPFNQAQFDAARASGKPIAVVFHADWCAACRAQAPLLKDSRSTGDTNETSLATLLRQAIS
jgi:thioredoxin